MARASLLPWAPVRTEQVGRPALVHRGDAVVLVAARDGLRVTAEFLRSRFSGPLEMLRFEARDLSPASAAVLRHRLERLATEFNELAEVDSTLPARRREGVGLLVACRPWAFSVVNALKKRPQAVGQRSNRA